MPRHDRLLRALTLIRLLDRRGEGMALPEIRQALRSRLGIGSLSEKTVRRDFSALECAGYPVERVATSRGSRYRLSPRPEEAPGLSVSPAELAALREALRLTWPLHGLHFRRALGSLWRKAKASASERALRHVRSLDRPSGRASARILRKSRAPISGIAPNPAEPPRPPAVPAAGISAHSPLLGPSLSHSPPTLSSPG